MIFNVIFFEFQFICCNDYMFLLKYQLLHLHAADIVLNTLVSPIAYTNVAPILHSFDSHIHSFHSTLYYRELA